MALDSSRAPEVHPTVAWLSDVRPLLASMLEVAEVPKRPRAARQSAIASSEALIGRLADAARTHDSARKGAASLNQRQPDEVDRPFESRPSPRLRAESALPRAAGPVIVTSRVGPPRAALDLRHRIAPPDES